MTYKTVFAAVLTALAAVAALMLAAPAGASAATHASTTNIAVAPSHKVPPCGGKC